MFRDIIKSEDSVRKSNEWVVAVYGEGAKIVQKYDPPSFFRGLDIKVGTRTTSYYTEDLLLFSQQLHSNEPLDAVKYAFLACQDLESLTKIKPKLSGTDLDLLKQLALARIGYAGEELSNVELSLKLATEKLTEANVRVENYKKILEEKRKIADAVKAEYNALIFDS